jgi:hypothetical protein
MIHSQFHKPLKISGPIYLSIPNTEEFLTHNSQFCGGRPLTQNHSHLG